MSLFLIMPCLPLMPLLFGFSLCLPFSWPWLFYLFFLISLISVVFKIFSLLLSLWLSLYHGLYFLIISLSLVLSLFRFSFYICCSSLSLFHHFFLRFPNTRRFSNLLSMSTFMSFAVVLELVLVFP